MASFNIREVMIIHAVFCIVFGIFTVALPHNLGTKMNVDQFLQFGLYANQGYT